ncbi:hypothetical protein [Sphingomonas segetis]|jgi:hypothetical protein|uniref:hypothetical protein n=1 Tax=Sphingomonas segetis TaxID=1104779 RepID=UPI0018AD3DFC|nr:hypothetical protein [Sphingomonas segetis]
MIPDYLRDEIVLRVTSSRLHRTKLKAICRALEIDLDAALDPGPRVKEVARQLPSRAPLYTGAIPFALEMRCGNNCRTMPARVIYASEGLNSLGEIQETTSTCQILGWDPDEAAPSWESMPESALPNALVRRLCEAVLDAVAEEQRRVETNNET